MQTAGLSRFSRAGAMQLQQCRRFGVSNQVANPQQKVPTQVMTPAAAPDSVELLASSFVRPLAIPGIRRAPRTPTLPADSKFRKYGSTTTDRLFPFVLTGTFLLPWLLITKYF